METPDASQPIQKKESDTGLPDALKAGLENLSGISPDDVKVHYNSAKPPQLNALAYVRATNINLGQEQYLPHEAWHVAEEKQGMVSATIGHGEIPVNDGAGLEREADVMGERAANKSL